jgi:preprotein translocase subunit Sss1
VILRALYGLKSSGYAWRCFLRDTIINTLKFEPTYADPDACWRLAKKPNGEEYYELLLVYVDNILLVSNEGGKVMDQLAEIYDLRKDSLGPWKHIWEQTLIRYRHWMEGLSGQ